MELVANFIAVLRKYTVYTGRAGRKEFWYFFLANVIIFFVIGILALIITAKSTGLGIFLLVVFILYSLAILVPSITVGIRRLHDTDKPGWLMLLNLVPSVGGIIVLILCALEGTPDRNQYGHVPADN